jgi:hypothetical protein
VERSCRRCNTEQVFEVPLFSMNEKIELTNLMQKSAIEIVKHLVDTFKLTHLNAKFIALHINIEYGQCNRCNFNKLDSKYIACPKCKALNFNWNVKKNG